MRYYHYEQSDKMKANAFNRKLDGILQKYFPDNDKWGAHVLFDQYNDNADLIEINKLYDIRNIAQKAANAATSFFISHKINP